MEYFLIHFLNSLIRIWLQSDLKLVNYLGIICTKTGSGAYWVKLSAISSKYMQMKLITKIFNNILTYMLSLMWFYPWYNVTELQWQWGAAQCLLPCGEPGWQENSEKTLERGGAGGIIWNTTVRKKIYLSVWWLVCGWKLILPVFLTNMIKKKLGLGSLTALRWIAASKRLYMTFLAKTKRKEQGWVCIQWNLTRGCPWTHQFTN